MNYSNFLARLTSVGLLFTAWVPSLQASSIVQIQQTASVTQANVNNGDWITFRISYNCSSLTQNATNAVITDQLDSNFELVSLTKSAHVQDATNNNGLITFTFNPTLPAGATGDVSIVVRFKAATVNNYQAQNRASVRATNSDSVDSNNVSVRAIKLAVGVGPTLTYDEKLIIDKNVQGEVRQNGGEIYYNIYHGHTYPISKSVANYTIIDNFPANVALRRWRPEYFPDSNQPVNVYYKTNRNAGWRAWPANPRVTTGSQAVPPTTGQTAKHPLKSGPNTSATPPPSVPRWKTVQTPPPRPPHPPDPAEQTALQYVPRPHFSMFTQTTAPTGARMSGTKNSPNTSASL
jgi:uncharacterized repeat protein (TIGR01451 family)